MATFHYVARDAEGRTVRGSVQAQSRLEAGDRVRAMGYWLLELEAEPEAPTPTYQFRRRLILPLFGGVPLTHLAVFFRQLATLIAAGVPLHQTLYSLSNQTRHSRLRRVLHEIQQSVLSGESLADAFDRYPEVFSAVQRALVRVGVSGGVLERCLREIADYLERELELRRLLSRVTFYPKLLLVVALIVPFQIPRLVLGWLGAPGGASAGQVLLDISWSIGQIILIILLIWATFRIASQSQTFRMAWDLLKISIPWLGFTLRQLALARFGRALGALYGAGVPISQAIRVAADASGNEYLALRIRPIAAQMEAGMGIAESFHHAGVFPPMVLDMVATGENAGEIQMMLEKVAEYYESEGKVRAEQAAWVLGLLLYLAIAIYIILILIQFYTGYFTGIFERAGE